MPWSGATKIHFLRGRQLLVAKETTGDTQKNNEKQMGGGPGLQTRQFRKKHNPPGMGCCILLRFHYDQEGKFAYAFRG